jgi:hypothetical protein
MGWALRYEGDLAAEAAEAALRAALPGVELVRKTATVFGVAAPPEEAAIPPGWVLYQPAVLDADPPRLPNARVRAAIEAERELYAKVTARLAGKHRAIDVDIDDL